MVRRRFEERFSSRAMALRYEQLYAAAGQSLRREAAE
jgi:hypothetical protein